MNADLDLEQRYRRVLRLLPGYYRARWEQDMVAAFLDSSLTGDAGRGPSGCCLTAPRCWPWRRSTAMPRRLRARNLSNRMERQAV